MLLDRVPARLAALSARAAAGTEAVHGLGLGSLGAEDLMTIRADDKSKWLLESSSPMPKPDDAWGLMERSDLRPGLVRRLRLGVPEEWSRALYEAIVLDTAEGAKRAGPALSVSAELAGALVPQHERAIFMRCVALLDRKPDPYSPSTGQLLGPARSAASAILAVDETLDENVITTLAQGRAPLLLAAVSSALQASAAADDARRFLTYARGLELSGEQLVRFAEDCDSLRSASDPPLAASEPSITTRARLRYRLEGPTRAIAPFLLGPFAAIVFALAARHLHGRLTMVDPGIAVAIGALAVLAAVHVLSVQLAGSGLPSPIGAAAIFPTEIRIAYGLTLAVLAVELLAGLKPPPKWHAGAVGSVLLIVFFLVLIAATVRTLRYVSPAGASAVAARRARPLATSTGRIVDRMRREDEALQDVVSRRSHVRMHMSPDESARRQPLQAGRPGLLDVDVARIDSLGDEPIWDQGDIHLDVMASPGASLAAGVEFASIVLADRASLTEPEYKAVADAFQIRRDRRLERLAELCAALVDEMAAVGHAGDLAGARVIEAELLTLLRLHLVVARGDSAADARNPPSPALLAVVNRTVSALARSSTEDVRDLCIALARGVLAYSGKLDPTIGLITTRAVSGQAATLSQLTMLYEAGRRGVDLRSEGDVANVQRTLHKLVGGTSDNARYADEVSARLVQYAAVADPLHSRRVWSRYRDACGTAPEWDRVLNFARIGAAALRVSNLSLAVETALALPAELDLERLREHVREEEGASRENLLSRLYGRLLGTDAETRIARYIDAAAVFRA